MFWHLVQRTPTRCLGAVQAQQQLSLMESAIGSLIFGRCDLLVGWFGSVEWIGVAVAGCNHVEYNPAQMHTVCGGRARLPQRVGIPVTGTTG
jgi:hypothetical protein